MNRIADAFKNNKNVFIAFVTGGDPDVETTGRIVSAMAESGADMIVIGIPFSDTVIGGPVIKQADERALAAGCTVDKLFDTVRHVRENTEIPMLFVSYMNPIYVFGTDRFVALCAHSGIDGLIVPDLPFEEKDELELPCRQQGIALIPMIVPAPKERLSRIVQEAEGFLYCVSSLSLSSSGLHSEAMLGIKEMISQVKEVKDIPCAAGFEISSPGQAWEMAAIADGVIIDNEIVRLVAQHGRDSEGPVREFVKGVREALDMQG